jgi:hypothetical protein
MLDAVLARDEIVLRMRARPDQSHRPTRIMNAARHALTALGRHMVEKRPKQAQTVRTEGC